MVDDNKIDIPDNTDTQEIELQALREERKKNKTDSKTSVTIFLKKEISRLKYKSQVKPYDLEEEFAHTRRNRSFFVPGILILCVLFVCAMVYGAHLFINRFPVVIDLSDGFLEEVNVEDLADEITRTTVMYENSLRAIEALKVSHQEKLAQAQKQYEFDLFVIDQMNIEDKKDLRSRRNSAKSDYKRAVDEINSEMTLKLSAAEQESAAFKKRLESYEKQEEKNQSESENIDEKELLFRLEREKIIRDYEERIFDLKKELSALHDESQKEKQEAVESLSKKYQEEIAGLDPELNDKNAKEIISSGEKLKGAGFNLSKYTDKAEKVSDQKLRETLRKAQTNLENYEYLYNTVKNLPQKHSVPLYVKTGNKLVVNAVNEIVENSVESINSLSDAYTTERSERLVMQDAVLSLMTMQGKKAVVLQSFSDKLRLYVNDEIFRQIQKQEKEAYLFLNNRKIEGKMYQKNGVAFFEPASVDLSEEIKDFRIISVGTQVFLADNP